MGASRESFDLFNKWGRSNFKRRLFREYGTEWRLMWGDTFMRFVCFFLKHKKYDAGEGDIACKRCCKYVGHYEFTPPAENGLIK